MTNTLQTSDLFAGPSIPQVFIRHTLDHKFVVKEKKPGKKKPPPGCALCNAGKHRTVHHPHPPTLNDVGSGDRHFYQDMVKVWKDRWTELLEATVLPKPCGFIYVSGTICFPTRAKRDQGNFRAFTEKTLGDALEDGGWLVNDDWSSYEFGQLGFLYQYGQAWIELELRGEDEPRLLAGLG